MAEGQEWREGPGSSGHALQLQTMPAGPGAAGAARDSKLSAVRYDRRVQGLVWKEGRPEGGVEEKEEVSGCSPGWVSTAKNLP